MQADFVPQPAAAAAAAGLPVMVYIHGAGYYSSLPVLSAAPPPSRFTVYVVAGFSQTGHIRSHDIPPPQQLSRGPSWTRLSLVRAWSRFSRCFNRDRERGSVSRITAPERPYQVGPLSPGRAGTPRAPT